MPRSWLEQLGGRFARWHPSRRSSDYQRAVRNAFFNAGEGVITPLLWLVSTPILVAKLGTDHFGIWMLVNGVIGAGGILSLGLTEATTKFVAKYRAAKDDAGVRRVTRATFFLYLVLGIVAAALLVLLAPLLSQRVFALEDADRPLAEAALMIGAAGILARFIDNVFSSVFQGFERFDLNVRVSVGVASATMVLNVALVLLGYGLNMVLLCTVVFVFVGSFAKAALIRRKLDPGMRLAPCCDLASLRELLSFGFYTWIQRVLGILAGYLDRFLIAAHVGMTELTYYTVCLQLVNQIAGLFQRGAAFLFPFSAALLERGEREKLRAIYNQAHDLLIVLACATLVPIYVCSEPILRVWMGAEFAGEATLLLSLLALRYVFAPLSAVNANFLMGLGYVRIQAALVTLSSGTLVLGMLWFIPRQGALGAVIAQFLLIPLIFLNRYVMDRKLFGQLNVAQVFAFYLPVLVCLALASAMTFHVDTSKAGLVSTLLILCLSALGFGAVAAGVLSFQRRLGLFPK